MLLATTHLIVTTSAISTFEHSMASSKPPAVSCHCTTTVRPFPSQSTNRDLLREVAAVKNRLLFLILNRNLSRDLKLIHITDACFVLCDFMEEILPLMFRFQASHQGSEVLDWAFWLTVCKKMMQSHNTLTKVRLIAFVYSLWNVLIFNEQMKDEMCLDWLLGPAFFQEHFEHWCPMVRHYFQRLLCWRLARYDGVASDLDM
jgi:hypothetical protein